MDAIEAGLPVLFQECRSTNVGCQHAFFDQAMGIVTHNRNDIVDFALFIEEHHRLDRLKINRTAFVPCLEQNLEQRVKRLEARQ